MEKKKIFFCEQLHITLTLMKALYSPQQPIVDALLASPFPPLSSTSTCAGQCLIVRMIQCNNMNKPTK